MRKHYTLLFFICLAFPCLGQAQDNPGDLLKSYQQLNREVEEAKAANQLQKIIALSKQMVVIGKQLNQDSLVMNAQILYGQALAFFGIFDGALNTYHELLTRAEQSNNCYYKVKTATLIGAIHQNTMAWKKSQEFLLQAKQSAIACGMYGDTILINYDIARNMLHLGQPREGIDLIRQNLEVSRKIPILVGQLNGLNKLANLLAEAGLYKEALEVGLQVFQLPENLLDGITKAQTYQMLSQIAYELKDLAQAQQFLDQALHYAKAIELNDLIYECYRTQSDIDKSQGKFESAVKNFQLYSDLKDSVYQDEYNSRMSAMIALYDLDTKEKAISMLEKDQKIKDGAIQLQRILMLVGLLALLLIIFIIRFQNQRKTNRMREAFAQDLLKAQEEERQKISRELHDSVGQNILVIKNRLQRLVPAPDKPLVDSVDAALEEVRNIAKDLYPNQLEQYGLRSAVETLCATVQESSGIFVSSDLQGIDDKLTREAKINVYRIIQECMNNAMKHAEASAIRITSEYFSDRVDLVVQDNGKGFDKSMLERKANRSFGMVNMMERIKMLRGKFHLETSAQQGAKLTFSIPV